MNVHEGITCNFCARNNFRGIRHKCLICSDYDLCSECFELGISSHNHVSTHPMQSIFTRLDMKLFYGGEHISSRATQCLTCPYCGELGFTGKTLMRHLIYSHPNLSEDSFSVLCPICASRPIGNFNYTTNDLPGHLAVEHHIIGPRSLIDRIDDTRARALRNPQPVSSPTLTRRSTFTRSGRNPSDTTFLELMSRLPDVGFSSDAGGEGNPQSLQALQQLQLQLQQNQLEAQRQQDLNLLPRGRGFSAQHSTDFPPLRDAGLFASTAPSSTLRISTSNSSREATAMALQAVISRDARRIPPSGSGRRFNTNRTGFYYALERSGFFENNENIKFTDHNERNPKTEENDMFILSQFPRNNLSEMEHTQLDRDRADRSLFVQSLLLSAFSTDFSVKDEKNSNDAQKTLSSKTQVEEKKSKKKDKKKNKKKVTQKPCEGFCVSKVDESGLRASTEGQTERESSKMIEVSPEKQKK